MLIKLIAENRDVEIDITFNSLFENEKEMQEAINYFEKMQKEQPERYNLIGDLIINEDDSDEPYWLSELLSILIEQDIVKRLTFKVEESLKEILLINSDVTGSSVVIIRDLDKSKIRAYTCSNGFLIAKALFYSEIISGW